MSPFHSLSFTISEGPGEISPGHPLWIHPLSGRSPEFTGTAGGPEEGWAIGEYFTAARAFVSRQDILVRIAEVMGGDGPAAWQVTLDLQKHGAFYHPIKMTVADAGSGATMRFVLNGAVSEHGRHLAGNEGALFSVLENRLPSPATPKIYAAGEVSRPRGPVGFLLGQWLEGYHEFHRSGNPDADVVVWRPGETDLHLPMDRVLPAYENIARILTLAYEPATGGQILFWHHGAGDFILDPLAPDLPVRLITIREYGSITDDDILAQGPLPGLLFFCVNLCLRMQLDRIEGVGEPVFLGKRVLGATLAGFFKGLEGKGAGAARETRTFLREFSQDQVMLVAEHLLEAWPVSPSERALVQGQIPELACQITVLLKSGRFFDFC